MQCSGTAWIQVKTDDRTCKKKIYIQNNWPFTLNLIVTHTLFSQLWVFICVPRKSAQKNRAKTN